MLRLACTLVGQTYTKGTPDLSSQAAAALINSLIAKTLLPVVRCMITTLKRFKLLCTHICMGRGL